VIEIERTALRELGVAWSLPKEQVGGADNGWPKGVRAGFSADLPRTQSLMATLSQLEGVNQAEIRANPQVICRSGKRAQLIAVQDEWFMMSEPDPNVHTDGADLEKIEYMTGIDIMPHMGDGNDITLETAITVNDNYPKGQGQAADLWTDAFPWVRHPIAIQSGGTVVLAGLPTESGGNDQTTRVIAIFVTATRVPGIGEVALEFGGLESWDPESRTLSEQIARIEQDLAVLRQTRAEANPDVVRQKTLLNALRDRLENRRTELKREFESDLREALNRAAERTESSSSADINISNSQAEAIKTSGAFTKVDLFNELVEIGRRFGVNVAVDLSVKTQPVTATLTDATPEAAIRKVLKDTPYTFRVVSESGRLTCMVYRPITAEFQQIELMQALDEIAEMAEVPIVPAPSIEGKITAQGRNADLAVAGL
jgi:hypothetical protein